MIFLSDNERAQLRAQHKRERDGRVRNRIKAVLLYDKGWSVAAIAEALLLSEDAIREHINEYKESKKLKPENGGSTEKLSLDWIQKGVRKEIPSNSGRSRINLSGIIDVIDHKVLVQEDKTLNAEATISFFRKIEEAYPEKTRVHVFCDNARYYRNKTVIEYLKTSKVRLHFLPPYSPNLNPIERLWKWIACYL